MPLSEFYKMARGKLESSKQKTDLSYVPNNEFVELVWENGQVLLQGQSSRARKSPNSGNFESHSWRLRDIDLGNATNSKMEKFGLMDSVLDDLQTVVPSGETGLGQDEDMVPWLSFPIDELLPEISGVTANELPLQNSFASFDKRINFNPTAGDSHNISLNSGRSFDGGNASKVSSSGDGSKGGLLHPWSFQQGHTSVPSLRSGVSGIVSSNTSNARHVASGDSARGQASAAGLPSLKTQKQDVGLPSNNFGFFNFSHFARPAALARANLQHADAVASVSVEGLEGKGKEALPNNGNLANSLRNLSSAVREEMGSHSQTNLVSSKVEPKPIMARPVKDLHISERSEAICQEDAAKNDRSPGQVVGANVSKARPDGEKTIEPIIASSSVCSVNSAERASNNPTPSLKRKFHETDESEGRSDDVEEESVGVRKAAPAKGGTGSKRSRAAEVHNLSERRRRDRINEKMRALQELIPNCNKVDKASMLDEAIEYLKTLQLQVQMMSMGAGLYMPQMMWPPGMQPLHAAHMAHFSPMGVGMGMGMGFGMGMMDMNSGHPRRPIFQVPPMQGAHFPLACPSSISPATGFPGMGPNFPFFGYPGQGHPISGPCPPLVPLSVGTTSTMGLGTSTMLVPVDVPNPALPSDSKGLMQNVDSQLIHSTTNTSSSMKQTSTQCQATDEGLEHPGLTHEKDLAPDVGGSEAVCLTK